jgi:hypothetical protein
MVGEVNIGEAAEWLENAWKMDSQEHDPVEMIGGGEKGSELMVPKP